MAESRIRVLAEECISVNLADILHKVGIRHIYRFDLHFANGTPDEQWVPEAVSRGLVCLSCDRKMVAREQIAAFLSNRTARMILLPSSFAGSRLRVQLAWMLNYWDKIQEHAAFMAPGAVVVVNKRGRIRAL